MKRFHSVAVTDFVWRKNTMLCASLDIEAKWQDLGQGSKEKAVHLDTGSGPCPSGERLLRAEFQGRGGGWA